MLLIIIEKNSTSCRSLMDNVDVAKVLIQNGADVNAVDRKTTALHIAASKDTLNLRHC